LRKRGFWTNLKLTPTFRPGGIARLAPRHDQ
jgi:hypothetical protein